MKKAIWKRDWMNYGAILLNPLLILAYYEGMRRIYELCQYGGARRRLPAIIFLGAAGILWVACWSVFWLKSGRKKAAEGASAERVPAEEALAERVSAEGSGGFSDLLRQYGGFLLGVELLCLLGITFLFGYRIYQSAQPFNGHLAWYLWERRGGIEAAQKQEWETPDEPSGKVPGRTSGNAPGESSGDMPGGMPGDVPATTPDAEVGSHTRGDVVAENDELTYYLDGETFMKLSVVDAALGSRMYAFTGPGVYNPDPFPEIMGVARGILFFDEDTGLVLLGSASDSFSRLFFTGDGGESFQLIEPPVEDGAKDIQGNLLGYTVEDYDYPGMPYVENGRLYLHVSTEAADQNTQYLMFCSQDLGATWNYLGYYEDW